MDAVDQIKEYIASGHIYQANLSQRFQMDFTGNAFNLFNSLFQNNPAPFFSFINAGDYQIISTSPERFLYRNNKYIETRPIKGTRPRGTTPSKDKALGKELLHSKKDDAELSMIVDLLRNDFGKVCHAGSVRVSQHKMLESYKNVFHLVSIVQGVLADNKDSVDLIEACFPGGSITGCPKIRSMEIIDELESTRRHIYTGSIGYISFHNTMDLSIAIRTATVYNQRITFSVGGGVVYDSDPKDEFNETLHKGQTLMKAFKGKDQTNHQTNAVWINGSIESSDSAMIPISDMGFLYGYGFFETIRVNKGNAIHLNAHIERFNNTWKSIFPNEPPDISWKDVISQVVSKNQLSNTVAAVKLIATRGDKEQSPHNNTLIVMARPYEHRLIQKKKADLDIAVYPEPRQTPLARYKTMNYLYYYLAGKWAQENGYDEAIILNPDNTISETNTANILLLQEKTVIKPVSDHVLPGVMENIICDLLPKWGYTIEAKKLQINDLFDNAQVILTNALMGAVPVLSIDGKATASPTDMCEKINQEVL
jgi:para-aminobenzoate synthetase component 1